MVPNNEGRRGGQVGCGVGWKGSNKRGSERVAVALDAICLGRGGNDVVRREGIDIDLDHHLPPDNQIRTEPVLDAIGRPCVYLDGKATNEVGLVVSQWSRT